MYGKLDQLKVYSRDIHAIIVYIRTYVRSMYLIQGSGLCICVLAVLRSRPATATTALSGTMGNSDKVLHAIYLLQETLQANVKAI